MSHYAVVEVQYNDKAMLVEALVNAGFDRDQIEVHDTPQMLKNYNGTKTMVGESDPRFAHGDTAHVIIRKNHIGNLCNDYGIYVDPVNGSREFVCDWARNNTQNCIVNPVVKRDGGFGKWSKRLKREYAAAIGTQQFHDQGLIPERVDAPDGSVYVYANC
jgi:hypothetical protein